MTNQDIVNIASDIMSKYNGMTPGQIYKLQTLEARYRTPDKHKRFYLVINLLLANDFLNYDGQWVRLTDKGFSYLNDETPLLPLLIDLKGLLNVTLPLDKVFYDLWEIVGGDNSNRKDQNPYYVENSTFYDVAITYLKGYPPSYSEYMQDWALGESRLALCKELFFAIEKDSITSFLDKLSEKINAQFVKSNSKEIKQETSCLDNEIKQDDKLKTKIFISHKTEDLNGFVKPLVDMMILLGVSEKDIFCSSYPGFGVPFGESILDGLASQFNDFNLMVIFVHSPRYYQSAICLNEMGAAWILKNDHYSFLTKDCEFDMLTGIVSKEETAFRAGQENTYHVLNEFKEKLENIFGLEPKNMTRWETIKNDFLNKVNEYSGNK